MADLTALIARIRRTVGDVRGARFHETELIVPIINSGMRELAHITQKYNVIDAAFVVTANNSAELPDGFIGINRVRNSAGNPIWKIDFRQVKDWNVGTSTSPSFYAIKSKKIHLVPTPSTNQTIELDYIGVPTDLSLGADVIPDELGPFRDSYVVAYACKELSIIGQDFEAAQQFSGQLGTYEMRSRDWANTEDMFEGHQVYFDGSTDDSYGRQSWLV